MNLVITAAVAALAQSVPVGEPRGSPTPEQFTRLREAFEEKLLDFPSARFRAVRADSGRVCGQVNAKNSFGAFTGWKPFGSIDSPSGTILVIDDAYLLEPICTPALMATPRDYAPRLQSR